MQNRLGTEIRTPSLVMKTSWLHATLLPLFLFGTALPEKLSHCKVPAVQRVEVHGSASVSCPSIEGQEITFTLHNDKNKVSVSRNVTNEQPINASVGIIHQGNLKNNTSVFVLTNLMAEQTGVYFCEALKTFPPPVRESKEGPLTILVVVGDRHQPTPQQCDPSSPDNHLSLWVGLGLLTLYGLVITCTAFSLRSRLTKGEFNKHDYMNVKPRARRRNRGKQLLPRLSWYTSNSASVASCKLSSKRLPV